MNRYLLDTNTCIDYLRGHNSRLVARIKSKRPRELRLSAVVVGELFFGAFRSADPARNLSLVRELVNTFVSLPFDDRAAEIFGEVRANLTALGQPIGPYDLQIAAIALARNLVLVTHNVNEFSRVPNLHVEDWLAQP